MLADELEVLPGVIWTALNIDYSGHSFSHLGVYHGEPIPSVSQIPLNVMQRA
jgi:hypothetical protein